MQVPSNTKEIYLGNAGTAARFLTTVCTMVQRSTEGERTIITGNARMKQRPIAPLVAALTDPWPGTASLPEVRTFLRGRPPGGADDLDALADWLASASVVPTEDLIPAVDDEADGADRKDNDD